MATARPFPVNVLMAPSYNPTQVKRKFEKLSFYLCGVIGGGH